MPPPPPPGPPVPPVTPAISTDGNNTSTTGSKNGSSFGAGSYGPSQFHQPFAHCNTQSFGRTKAPCKISPVTSPPKTETSASTQRTHSYHFIWKAPLFHSTPTYPVTTNSKHYLRLSSHQRNHGTQSRTHCAYTDLV